MYPHEFCHGGSGSASTRKICCKRSIDTCRLQTCCRMHIFESDGEQERWTQVMEDSVLRRLPLEPWQSFPHLDHPADPLPLFPIHLRSCFGGCVHLGCTILLLQSICKLTKDNRGRPRDIQRDVHTSNTNARSSSTPSTVATIVGAVAYIRRPPIPRTHDKQQSNQVQRL